MKQKLQINNYIFWGIILILALIPFAAVAQEVTFDSFLDEGKIWTIRSVGSNLEQTVSYTEYKLIGNSTFDGVSYKQLFSRYRLEGEDSWSEWRRDGAYIGQDEQGRVYYYEKNSYSSEKVVTMDFSLHVGDEYRLDDYSHTYIVTEVSDTILENSFDRKPRRCIHLSLTLNGEIISGDYYRDVWIEGIGSVKYGQMGMHGNMPGGSCLLMKCTQPEGVIYQYDDAALAQDDYIPLVKEGKQWHMVVSKGDEVNMLKYMLTNEEVVKDEKTYFKLCSSLGDVVHNIGLLREENQKVYFYDSGMQEEFLLFDYSLKPGDTFETFSYDDNKKVSYTVLSVGDCLEGPEVIRNDYDQATGSTITNRRYLRKWTVCRTDNNYKKTWIEGVGSYEGPMDNLYDASPISSAVYLAYVEDGYGDLYLPFSFHDTMWRQAYGCDLPKGAADQSEDWHHQLTYELEGDRLHVYGKVWSNCGPNNYALFIMEPIYELSNESSVRKLHFEIQTAEPIATCMGLYETDFYIPGFDPNLNYIVMDNQGEEHPVINKTQQVAYRPFVEDGKVWMVGSTIGISDGVVKMVEYYYFDGDTIIDGKTCKKMMCLQYVSPDHPDYDVMSQTPSLRYVGTWYEESQKVYFCYEGTQSMKMMYDFSLGDNETLLFDNYPYVIGPKQAGNLKGFKGVYRDVMYCGDGDPYYTTTTWLEGVGGIDGPTVNVYYGKENHAHFLMSCTVGDEVIYLNDEYEDGTTSEGSRKDRFDFTHTIKTNPKAPFKQENSDACISSSEREVAQPEVKAPRRSDEAQSLYGEYNDLLLGIHLDPLDDAYMVSITNESGQVVYEKTINAGTIVGLSIDISAYAKGRYTVTVENSRESFTGEFEVLTTGISDAARLNNNEQITKNKLIYNLQGQRLSSLQKGLNIVNGKKVYVK